MARIHTEPFLASDSEKILKKRLDFYDCFQPVYFISRFFGLCPFTSHFDSNGKLMKFSVGVQGSVRFITSILLILVSAYFVRFSSKNAAKFESSMLMIADLLFWVVGAVMGISSIVLDMLNRNRKLKIIKTFIVVDKNVKRKKSVVFSEEAINFYSCFDIA